MSTLIQLANEQVELAEYIIDKTHEGYEIPQEYYDKLAGLVGASEEKIDNWVNYLLRKDSEIEFMDKAISEATAKLKSLKASQARRVEFCKHTLYTLNSKSLEGRLGHKIWTQTNSRVEIDVEPQHLPADLVRTKTTFEPDKHKIKDRLENGETVDGCKLVHTEHVRYK